MDMTAAANLIEVFEEMCRRQPDDVAVTFAGDSLTYRQLQERAEHFAAGLCVLTECDSVAPLVAIVLEPSLGLVEAVMAVVLAGAAYLPVDAATPDDYLDAILDEAEPTVVITGAERATRLGGRRTLTLNDLAGIAGSASAAPATRRAVSTDAPAYVVFTSGSTGAPKGVVVSHGALLNSTAARMVAYGVPTRVALLHSIAFDLSSGVLAWALLGGGTLVVSRTPLSDVPGTLELIRRERLTHLVYPASLYAPFLERAAADPPTGLRGVMIGSERWSSVLIERHARLMPTTSLFNEYGPSEACVWSSYACVYDGDTGRSAELTLGRPVINTGYLVLDEDGSRVSSGGTGELLITGRNLATGYLHRPELTAERFITLPDGERAYRTGDLVEVTEEGTHVFLGRTDRQLKVQGNRIEAGHVETVLMSHPDIEQAYVMSRDDTGLGSTLVAYVVVRGESAPENLLRQVREFMAPRAPLYMIPSTVVILPGLPRNHNGKIDERRLPVPGTDDVPDMEAPDDYREARLVTEVATILGRSRVGVRAPLNELGANSLAYVRISAMITSVFGVEVPASELFAGPSVRELAARITTAAPTSRPRLARADGPADTAPLSLQQQQIWFLHHLSPETSAYYTQFSINLTGSIDVDALERALSFIVRRHEILRTTFHPGAGGPYQRIHEPWSVSLPVTDLSGLDPDAAAAALEAHKRAEIAKPLDIGRLPLVQWYLYRLSTSEWVLFQREHHFIHDGWSASLFLGEIRDAYDAIVRGAPPQLATLPVQYADYARWQVVWQDSDDFRRQGDYWEQRLAGADFQGVTFEPDRRRPVSQTFVGNCLRADLSGASVDAIDRVCAVYGVTRFAVFLSAFALLVWQHTRREDFVVGSALSNRRQAETADLLGMFVNALPIRLFVDPHDTVGDVARHTMRTLVEAQDSQEFPFIETVKRIGLPRTSTVNPLFQLMFAFHDSPRPQLVAHEVRGQLWIDHNGSAKNDLNVVCVPHPPRPGSGRNNDGINILWEYNSDLFCSETGQALLDGYLRLVEAMPALWSEPVSGLSEQLAPAQLDAILAAGRGSDSAPPYETLPEGVAASIKATPSAIAVRDGDRGVTYAELDRLARGVQWELQHRCGVVPGDVVALVCGRSVELVAAWLAVLRIGAAYLTIDPEQPSARVDLLVSDASPTASVAVGEWVSRFAAVGLPVVDLRGVTPRDDASLPTTVAVSGSDAAYLIYTSGSTGMPKAVVTSHRNAVAALHARTVHFGQVAPRTLVTLPEYFDVAASMVFWTLWRGGTVVLAGGADTRDPDVVRTLIDAHGVTHVNFVASFYRYFLNAAPKHWRSSLMVVAIGGEPCSPDLVSAHATVLPDVSLHNEYGPTEASVWSSVSCVHGAGSPTPGAPVTIGRPIANYGMYVLDERLLPMPVGARGELCVAGAGVVAGYLGRPELTEERFVVAADGPLAGMRLYRTGDEARLNRWGEFEILGRRDDQVKVRGYRIELGEVQRRIAEHPAVTEAFVCVEESGDDPQLVAYVAVPAGGGTPAGALREWAARTLPGYMVPATFITLDRIPLTATGKIDRSRLAALRIETPREMPEESTPVQQKVLAWWRQLLGSAQGLDQDFFAAGGDSLRLIRLVSLARADGYAMTVAQALQAPTVRLFAAMLDRGGSRQTVERRPAGTRLPLTAIQQWYLAQDFAVPHHFNQSRLLEVDSGIPTEVLRSAIRWTAARHDAFRSRFVAEAGLAYFILGDQLVEPLLGEIELTEPSAGGNGTDLLGDHAARMQESLHPASGRLHRLTLFVDPATGRRWLHLVLHHLIVDAASWDIVLGDIAWACRELCQGSPLADRPATGAPEVAPPPVDLDKVGYWLNLVKEPKPRALSGDTSRPAFGEIKHLEWTASPHATRYLLQQAPRLHQVTAQSVVLAMVSSALQLVTGETALYTFLEHHGRDGLTDAAEAVGWFTALYPVLLSADPAADLPLRARAFDHQLSDIRDPASYGVARYLHPESAAGRALSRLEAPGVTVNYLGERLNDPGGVLRPAPVADGFTIGAANLMPTSFDVTAVVVDGVLRVRAAYDPVAMTPERAEAFGAHAVDALERAARIVPLAGRSGAGRAELLLVHPVGGSVEPFVPLARKLAPRRSWGVAQDPGESFGTVAQLAACHVGRVVQLSEAGRYVLAGWSFGAVVAFEMVRRMAAEGIEIEGLVLVDPPALTNLQPSASVLQQHLAALLPDVPDAKMARVTAQLMDLAPGRRPGHAVAELLGPDVAPSDTTAARIGMVLRNHEALAGWRPTGQVASLRIALARRTLAAGWSDLEMWGEHSVSPVALDVIEGDHVSILQSDDLVKLLSAATK